MRNALAGGYTIRVEPGKQNYERDSFTCFHCQRVTFVEPFCEPAEAGGLCYVCNHHICKNCVGKECSPFLKQLEEMEAKQRFRDSLRF